MIFWSIFAAAVVLLLPGSALLAWISSDSRRPSCEKALIWLADAAALSISITALVGLVSFSTGLRFTGPVVVALYGGCLVVLLAALFRRLREPLGQRSLWRQLGCWLAAAAFVAGLAAWRLYQARTLALPAWVDPVHHTLTVRLILERGGIPADILPYIPAPFVYHFGFHLAAALFSFVSGAAPEQAVLWFGQALNGFAALSVYRVAAVFRWPPAPELVSPEEEQPGRWSVWRARFSTAFPVLAALLVGFVFHMPAYYLTWGRFTLLAGLLLVGPAIGAAMEAWEDPIRKGVWARLALLIAGLALTHYFTLLLLALFLMLPGAAALFQLFRGQNVRKNAGFLWRLMAFGSLGLLLASPWIGWVLQNNGQQANIRVNLPLDGGEAAQQSAADYLRYLDILTGPRRNHILLANSALGLLSAWRLPRRRFLVIWALLLALFSLPWGLRFEPFRPDYFAIVLFFPATLLLAALLVDGAAALGALARPWQGALALGVASALLLTWGIKETRNIINPVTVFAVEQDVRALDWVREHTEPEARFFINVTPWQGTAYRGVDGGYWLTPYTGRGTLLPPVFYGWGAPEYVAQITDWAQRATKIAGCTADFWALASEANLTHVYLREGQGSLQPAALAECPRLRPIYQEEGVTIYEILPLE